MGKFTTILGFYLCSVTLMAELNPQDPIIIGTVKANTLHVRAKPGQQYEVVNRLHEGDQVRILKEEEKWLGIAAPKQTEAWVSLNQLKQNTIIKDQVPVYSGPGTIFTFYHYLNRGDIVTVSRINENQWAHIGVPEKAMVWVYKSYIEYSYPEEPKELPELEIVISEELKSFSLENDPIPLQDSIDGKDQEFQIFPIAPKEPKSKDLTVIGEEIEVVKSGTIVPLNEINRPFKFALAKRINQTYYPLSYLSPGLVRNLDQWEGKPVSIAGTQNWIRGWPRPRIKVSSIKFFDESDKKQIPTTLQSDSGIGKP